MKNQQKGKKRSQKLLKKKRQKPRKRCPECGFRAFDGKVCRSGVTHERVTHR